MFEKCNPSHPDKIADRIAGALVDIAYSKQKNPKIAVEVLIGHGIAHIIAETSVHIDNSDVESIVKRIGGYLIVDYREVPQDIELAKNQEKDIRCGDNGIFKGVPVTEEEKSLTKTVQDIYKQVPYDGKYIINGDKVIMCQSHINSADWRKNFPNWTINPLGDWTGGTDVDSGATNRKLGSDMAGSVTGGGLCLSGDSQFISDDYKWYDIKDYKSGQKVGQWNNGKLEFVEPTKYIHNQNDDFIYIHNNSKLSMCLTPYHQILIKTSKNNLIKKPAYLIAEKLNKKIGNSGKIIHNFIYDNKTKSSQYEDINDYKLQVAFCADGTIISDSNKKWNGRIRVKKEYKKQELRKLLNGKEYKETQDNEYSIFWYKFAKKNKSLYECFKDENWDILKDEVFKWDGNFNDKIFRTTKKEDADFIQFVLQSYGYCVSITKDDRVGQLKEINGKEYENKSISYCVKILKSTTTGLRKSKDSFINVEYLKEKQDSYCFNVPSHNLVIRHNDKIFITGNCGKDLSKADVSVNIYAFLKAQETQKPVELFCAIGDDKIDGKPYSEIVEIARKFIKDCGGFEKFAEWGLVRG